MSMLDEVSTGVVQVPDLMLVYGPEGVGKTTFASKAPKPIILDLEKGSKRIAGVSRYDKAENYDHATQFIADMIADPKGFQTLVIDSTSELERMIWKKACQDNGWTSIEDPGFGKGYVVVMNYWINVLAGVKQLQAKHGTNVIFIGHSEMKTFSDPKTNANYDRYQIKLDKRAYALFRERMDFVGFADFVTYTKGKDSDRRQKAFGDGTRKLYTERRPAFDAKNRLGLPLEIPFEYAEYAIAAHENEAIRATRIRGLINELLLTFSDEALKKTVSEFVAKCGDNTTDLTLALERLRSKKEEEKANGLPAVAGN